MWELHKLSPVSFGEAALEMYIGTLMEVSDETISGAAVALLCCSSGERGQEVLVFSLGQSK